ncbi:hypothetical protein M3193_09580 [Sporosarcina luteola]|uniref:hypothetical protein n=1 Tax=Sporosarcina luteola TaxID=582850 RepID=UPI002041A3B1|nr:hypothetical protein [Sporosarcina luteola]MCM3744393.1 hypothetical protein [Sporosarcina luteola]
MEFYNWESPNLWSSGDKLGLSGDKVAMNGDKLLLSGDKVVMNGDKPLLTGDNVFCDQFHSLNKRISTCFAVKRSRISLCRW